MFLWPYRYTRQLELTTSENVLAYFHKHHGRVHYDIRFRTYVMFPKPLCYALRAAFWVDERILEKTWYKLVMDFFDRHTRFIDEGAMIPRKVMWGLLPLATTLEWLCSTNRRYFKDFPTPPM